MARYIFFIKRFTLYPRIKKETLRMQNYIGEEVNKADFDSSTELPFILT